MIGLGFSSIHNITSIFEHGIEIRPTGLIDLCRMLYRGYNKTGKQE